MRHRNATYAFIEGVRRILAGGQRIQVRGDEVLEVRNHLTTLERPVERCIVTPRRHNNIFATIAETMWVLAGRDDLAFISHYLRRAPEFSDDGTSWRAA